MLEKASLGELWLGIIDHPGRTLANITAYPRWRWLLPALLCIASLGVVSYVLLGPRMVQQSAQMMAQQLSRMPASQAEQVRQSMAMLQSPVVAAAISFGSGLLGLLAGWLIEGTLLYFEDLVAGGELDFKRVLATLPWLSVPPALEGLLQSAYVLNRGKLIVNQGLGYLASSGNAVQDTRNLAYLALSQVSLFRLWHLVLVYALFRGAARFGRGTSFWLTVLYQALLLGGQLALAAVGRLASGG